MTRNRILVVDDEATIRRFLVRVLEHAGYEVRAATNGREALQLLADVPFDLLLTDIRMDLLDGIGLLREAKTRQPDLAVILLTGHASVNSAVEALRHGVHDYWLKPVRNEEIAEAVAKALRARTRQLRRDRLEQIAGQLAGIMDGESAPSSAAAVKETVIECGPLSVNERAFSASLDGEPLELTPTEFRLLVTLARAPGAVLDYVQLVREACGYSSSRLEAREIIGTHVLNLRRKLGVEPGAPLYVEVVRGVGYRLIPPDPVDVEQR